MNTDTQYAMDLYNRLMSCEVWQFDYKEACRNMPETPTAYWENRLIDAMSDLAGLEFFAGSLFKLLLEMINFSAHQRAQVMRFLMAWEQQIATERRLDLKFPNRHNRDN